MKRRISGLILALALVVSLAVPAVSQRSMAAENVYFTAVNENLCLLTDDTMPFWSGGTLYVHSTVFSAYDLGLSYVKDSAARSVFLYSGGTLVEFDLAEGNANNGLGTYYSVKAVQKGGAVYLPVAFVCNYFDLSYSIVDTKWAPLVRVCSGSAILSDGQFVDAASSLMSSRYSTYVQSKKNSTITKPEEETPSSAGKTDEEEQESVTNQSSARVLLAVRVAAGDDVSAVLDTLDRCGYKAAFFFESAALAGQDDLLRRMIATGHSVGLVLDEGAAVTALDEGNAQLRRDTGSVTRLALTEQKSAAEAAGYAVYTPAILAENLGKTAGGRAKKVMNAISGKSGTVRVLFGSDETSTAALRTVCTQLYSGKTVVRAVNEVNCG